MLLTLLLVFSYQFSTIVASGACIGSKNNDFYYHQQTYNLIENIIKWHTPRANFWFVVSDGTLSDHDFMCDFIRNDARKIVSNQQVIKSPKTRNFAAIFSANSNRIESQLNMSLMLPPDVIKIYLDQSGCQLNTTRLAEIMSTLWLSDEIGFIYYISFCSLSTAATNYDTIDNTQRPHKDNYNCSTINLFYHQPFVKSESGQWGVLEKVDLINDCEGEKRQRINMSSQVFHDFPFRRQRNLKLNGLNMTVILFPSTGAYLKSEMEIFHNQLSKELLNDSSHNLNAYFGEDPELLRELQTQMNFTPNIYPTSDGQFFGFKQADGSFNGALGDIISRRADFIINGCFVKDYLTERLELTDSINDDKLCIVTKTAALVPDSLLIFRLFSVPVWISIIITVITVTLAYAILLTMIDSIEEKYRTTSRSLGKFRDKSFCIKVCRKIKDCVAFRVIGLMLGAPGLYGVRNSLHERFFVSICLLWSLILCGAFQGSLYNVYTTPKSYPNIDTLDDLYKSRLDIHVRHPGLLTDIFGDERVGTTIGNLRTERLRVTSDDFLNKRIATKGDVAGLARLANYVFDSNNIMPREDGMNSLHIVEECPRSYELAYLFRKGSIYIDTVNWNINMFVQSGLTVKWRKETTQYFKLEADRKIRRAVKEAKDKINLKHLQPAFIALFLGQVLSLLVLVLEKRLKVK